MFSGSQTDGASVLGLAEVAFSAVLFYFLIVAGTRLVGKRATAQLNNFDWIINITVGSLAASGILLKTVPVQNAAVAIAVIMALQFVLTKLVMRYDWLDRLVKSQPTLLTHKGEYIDDALKKTRVTREEIRAALRDKGFVGNSDANWVVLEADGRMTVIPAQKAKVDEAPTLEGVQVIGDVEPRERAREAPNKER